MLIQFHSQAVSTPALAVIIKILHFQLISHVQRCQSIFFIHHRRCRHQSRHHSFTWRCTEAHLFHTSFQQSTERCHSERPNRNEIPSERERILSISITTRDFVLMGNRSDLEFCFGTEFTCGAYCVSCIFT